MSERLLKSTESCKIITKRADHLETQCALLNEKVPNRMQKLTEKENAESIVRKTSEVQRDSVSFPSLALAQFSSLKLRQFYLFYWERNSFYYF